MTESQRHWATAQKAVRRKPQNRSAPITSSRDPAAWSSAAGNQQMLRAFRARPKLTISQPQDADEREADRASEQVMHGQQPSVSATGATGSPAIKRQCSACEATGAPCPTCATQPTVHRAATNSTPQSDTPAQSILDALRTNGQSLPDAERAFFEPRFRRDFSRVTIHTDSQAAELARSLGARAFTVGDAIAFAPGEFRQQDNEGRKLLAHELTHVVQNDGGSNGVVKRQGDAGVADAGATDAGATDAGPTDAGVVPGAQTHEYKGYTVTDDAPSMYDLLTRIVMAQGFDAMEDFVDSFEMDFVIPKRPAAGISDDPEFIRDSAIFSVLRAQADILNEDRNRFIDEFEDHARTTAGELLDDSQKRVLAEAERYGVTNLRIEFSFWLGIPEIKGDVADNASTRGIAIAAQGLLDRKTKAEKAVEAFKDYTSGLPALADLASQRLHSAEDVFAKYHADIDRTQRDLDVYRIQVQTRYPLLAALASDDDFKRSELEDLAKGEKGKNEDAASVIVDQVVEKLSNIAKVRNELKPGGDINLWRVPKLVAATKDELGVPPGSLHEYILNEKIEEEKPSHLTEILIGLVQLGLVLLAPFTEGLSLIPAAAISAGTAYKHFVEYETQSALHGTDFGAAALSAEEPSLFWLAVDIVGAGFDVGAAGGAALRIFRELAPAARALREAQVSEEAISNLERQAGELGGKELAEKIAQDARALHSTSEEVGITAAEAEKFEQAAKDVAKVAEEGLPSEVRSASTLAGGEVKVTRTGGIWSCSSPCQMMRERFKEFLARQPDYATKLDQLERRAAEIGKLPDSAAKDKAWQSLTDEAASMEREMRKTALPGDWTSPLQQDAPKEFNEMLERRGSVAAQLDHHPPDWTGRDEALFRYGPASEAEPGYRWKMNEDGSLSYERMDKDLPTRRFNPATGEFETAAEKGLYSAKKGAEQTFERATLPKPQQEAMDAAFEQRRKLIAERDQLEGVAEAHEAGKGRPLTPEETEKLKKLYAQINEQSRQLGEQAAEGVMTRRGGKKLYPLGKTHSTSGDFDQVWKEGEEFVLVEAKGGSSALGTRAVEGGMRAEQGTLEYAKSIAQNMAKSSDKAIRKLGNELSIALDQGKVKYLLVRAPIGIEAGEAALGRVKVTEFLLK